MTDIAGHIHIGQELHLDAQLALSLTGFTARTLLSGNSANSLRISSNRLVYVPGFERGVRPIGDWSMLMILSRCSIPSMRSYSPGLVWAPISFPASALYRMSLISVDLPEPETPVMQTSFPNGMVTSIFFRLFAAAPIIFRD